MKKELLDKEVFVAYDIRQVQRFLFAGSTLYDFTGANDILTEIFYEAFNYCVKHPSVNLKEDEYDFKEKPTDPILYFKDKKIQVQVVSTGGGNAFLLYRTGRLASKINRLFSSYLLNKTYSLEIAIAVVEKTNNMTFDNNRLYMELDRSKNSGVIPFPLASLALCDVEGTTGFPTVIRGHYSILNYSTVSVIKRKQTFLYSPNFDKSKTKDIAPYFDDIKRLEIFEKVKQTSPIIAYIHMDGNSMGMTIAKIKNGINDYERGIVLSRKIQANIQRAISTSLDAVKKWLAKALIENNEPDPDVNSHLAYTHIGGDDVNLFCDYHYALSLVECFISTFSKQFMWNDKRVGKIPFSACAGVAFCSNRMNDFYGISLAESCCSVAKKEAKKPENLINGKVGNWVYFQDCKYSQNFDFKDDIKRDYILYDGTSLCLRPYCLNKEYKNDVRYFGSFKKYYKLLKGAHLTPKIIELLKRDFSIGKFSVNTAIVCLKKNGFKLPKELYKTFEYLPSRGCDVALWFDALEIEGYFYDSFKEE